MYRIIVLPPAAKFLKKLKDKKLKEKYQEAIDQIIIDPYIGELKSGDLAGVYCYDINYNRTNYELAYSLINKDNNIIIVIHAGTRERFYEELKRYMKNTNIKQ